MPVIDHAHNSRRASVWKLAILASLGLLFATACRYKHRLNAEQSAYLADAPARVGQYLRQNSDARRELSQTLRELVGQPLENVKASLDPQGENAGSSKWKITGQFTGVTFLAFDDPATLRHASLRISQGKLRESWVITPAYQDPPLAGWEISERIRQFSGFSAALAWVATILTAYIETSLRRRMAFASVVLATVFFAACTLEPAPGLGGAEPHIPRGRWIAVGMLVCSLPPLVLRRRKRSSSACPHCNYDLTGNQSGICPECGEPTPDELNRRRRAGIASIARRVEFIRVS